MNIGGNKSWGEGKGGIDGCPPPPPPPPRGPNYAPVHLCHSLHRMHNIQQKLSNNKILLALFVYVLQ